MFKKTKKKRIWNEDIFSFNYVNCYERMCLECAHTKKLNSSLNWKTYLVINFEKNGEMLEQKKLLSLIDDFKEKLVEVSKKN
jgi:hypothetical protein